VDGVAELVRFGATGNPGAEEWQVNRHPTKSRRKPSKWAENLNQAKEEEKVMEASEMGSVWTESAKKAVELYMESGERMGKMMLEFHERSTSWARETMLAPLFEAQRTAGKQMMESSVEMARKLCGIDKRNGL
jgi:hypothetical protein